MVVVEADQPASARIAAEERIAHGSALERGHGSRLTRLGAGVRDEEPHGAVVSKRFQVRELELRVEDDRHLLRALGRRRKHRGHEERQS
jgi:hypothetical protein